MTAHRWLAATMAALSFLSASSVEAKIPRSTAVVAQFKRVNPCPSTGAVRGACSGWEVDHVVPLCAGGPDEAANMQWLTKEDHRQKTRLDMMRCRLKK